MPRTVQTSPAQDRARLQSANAVMLAALKQIVRMRQATEASTIDAPSPDMAWAANLAERAIAEAAVINQD